MRSLWGPCLEPARNLPPRLGSELISIMSARMNHATTWVRAGALASLTLIAACATGAGPRADTANTPAEAAAAPASEASGNARALSEAMLAGEFAWQDGRQSAAAKHYSRAAELSPEPAIVEHATRVSLVAREWELAKRNLARWKSLQPQSAGLLQAEVAYTLGTGSVDDGLAGFTRLLGLGEEGRKLAGQLLLNVLTPEVAGPFLDKAAELRELPGGVDAMVLLSQVALQLKRPASALQIADRAVQRHPQSGSALGWRARLYASQEPKDLARAKADFERALKLDPDDRFVRLSYAASLDDAGDPAAAARLLGEGVQDDEIGVARAAYAARANDVPLMKAALTALEALPPPRTDARHELLGQLGELTQDKERALGYYREIARGERWFPAQLRIAVLLDDLGRADEAKALIAGLREQGIDDDERLAESFLLEAELLVRHDQREEALAVYGRGLVALPDHKRLLYSRALLAERMDRVEESERDLRRIVALEPDDADALNALGYTIADRTDRYDEALALIERALAKKPDEPAIIDSMGWVQFRMGRKDLALEHLQRAFQLRPDPEIAAHLGEVLWSMERREDARRIWAQGEKLDPKNELLQGTIKRLAPQ